MTTKDYVKFAAALKQAREDELSDLWVTEYERLLGRFCEIFEDDNSKFNSDKFCKACGE